MVFNLIKAHQQKKWQRELGKVRKSQCILKPLIWLTSGQWDIPCPGVGACNGVLASSDSLSLKTLHFLCHWVLWDSWFSLCLWIMRGSVVFFSVATCSLKGLRNVSSVCLGVCIRLILSGDGWPYFCICVCGFFFLSRLSANWNWYCTRIACASPNRTAFGHDACMTGESTFIRSWDVGNKKSLDVLWNQSHVLCNIIFLL